MPFLYIYIYIYLYITNKLLDSSASLHCADFYAALRQLCPTTYQACATGRGHGGTTKRTLIGQTISRLRSSPYEKKNNQSRRFMFAIYIQVFISNTPTLYIFAYYKHIKTQTLILCFLFYFQSKCITMKYDFPVRKIPVCIIE